MNRYAPKAIAIVTLLCLGLAFPAGAQSSSTQQVILHSFKLQPNVDIDLGQQRL
jgi:hypothetical protein